MIASLTPRTTGRLSNHWQFDLSDKDGDPDPAGNLVDDVGVGERAMPWNAHAGARRLGPSIPKSDSWASAKAAIDQVGRVYTAQGFESDYVGVLFGPDLVYRPMAGGWVGQRYEPRDRIVSRGVTDVEFTALVKSTYRVLLTPGLRGRYVYFSDVPARDVLLGSGRTFTSSGGAVAEIMTTYGAVTESWN